MTNDEKYLIEINKSALDLKLGSYILKFLNINKPFNGQSNKPKENLVNDSSVQHIKQEKSITNIYETKINKLNVYYKDINNKMCDVCNLSGLILNVDSRLSEKQLFDCQVLNYILLTCISCNTIVHSNCLNNKNNKNLINFNSFQCFNCSSNLPVFNCSLCKLKITESLSTDRKYLGSIVQANHFKCELWSKLK